MGCVTSRTAVQAAALSPQNPAQPAADPSDVQYSIEQETAHSEDIRDKYDLREILGSGCFGQVRQAHLKQDKSQVRAVKLIEKDDDEGEWSNRAMFHAEVQLLQEMSHTNIIRFYDFYDDCHFLYVVMELCHGGEVFGKILESKRFSEKNGAFIGKQMLLAIEYIHRIHITHRGVKAENFMFSEPTITSQIKMIDFGMACKFEDGQYLSGLCGSSHYLAPEILGQRYSCQTDVWAFGVLMYLMMYGHYPHHAKHPRDIIMKILTETIRWQTKVNLSDIGLEFLQRCLEINPRMRITASGALQHPWIIQGAVEEDTPQKEMLPDKLRKSANQNVNASRKQVDPKVDDLRNQKLRKANDDWQRGICHGQRLGTTPQQAFMEKPEFVRRPNKLFTAPGNMTQLVPGMPVEGNGGSMEGSMEQGESAGSEGVGPTDAPRGDASTESTCIRRKTWRSSTGPRRLAACYSMSPVEEKQLKDLHDQQQWVAADGAMAGSFINQCSGNMPTPALLQ